MKKNKTFRLELDVIEKLEEISRETFKTQTQVIEELITKYTTNEEAQEETKKADTFTQEILNTLTEQLKVKDRQIEKLTANLESLQELTNKTLTITNQAQHLQAMSENKAIEGGKTPQPNETEDIVVEHKSEEQSLLNRLFGKKK